jgi:hypothetical protein
MSIIPKQIKGAGARERASFFIDGNGPRMHVPHLLVPDNAKIAVAKLCRYEPQINRTYADTAAHYGTQCSSSKTETSEG